MQPNYIFDWHFVFTPTKYLRIFWLEKLSVFFPSLPLSSTQQLLSHCCSLKCHCNPPTGKPSGYRHRLGAFRRRSEWEASYVESTPLPHPLVANAHYALGGQTLSERWNWIRLLRGKVLKHVQYRVNRRSLHV